MMLIFSFHVKDEDVAHLERGYSKMIMQAKKIFSYTNAAFDNKIISSFLFVSKF